MFGNSFSSDGNRSFPKGSSDFWITTLSPSGVLLSEDSFGGSSFDLGRGLASGSDGVLWLAGYSRSSDGDVSLNQGDNDMLIFRLSPDHVVLNSLSLGGSALDLAHDVIELSWQNHRGWRNRKHQRTLSRESWEQGFSDCPIPLVFHILANTLFLFDVYLIK